MDQYIILSGDGTGTAESTVRGFRLRGGPYDDFASGVRLFSTFTLPVSGTVHYRLTREFVPRAVTSEGAWLNVGIVWGLDPAARVEGAGELQARRGPRGGPDVGRRRRLAGGADDGRQGEAELGRRRLAGAGDRRPAPDVLRELRRRLAARGHPPGGRIHGTRESRLIILVGLIAPGRPFITGATPE